MLMFFFRFGQILIFPVLPALNNEKLSFFVCCVQVKEFSYTFSEKEDQNGTDLSSATKTVTHNRRGHLKKY